MTVNNKWLSLTGIFLVNFACNFIIFVLSYSQLAFPYLDENQRSNNADIIMSTTISVYALVAFVTGLLLYLIFRKK